MCLIVSKCTFSDPLRFKIVLFKKFKKGNAERRQRFFFCFGETKVDRQQTK